MIKAIPRAMLEKSDQMHMVLHRLRHTQDELQMAIVALEEMNPLDPMRQQLRALKRRLQTTQELITALRQALQHCAETYSRCEERNTTRSQPRPRFSPRLAWFSVLQPEVFQGIQLI
ncbi:MAG: hypothetical protein E7434_01935 [Ruminococcaceae bacterium]|nr:hypothetical protein [Oscillospiraceae bacterium]